MQRLFVIDRDLFAGFDVAQRAKENVAVQDLHERIRTARVIDVVRAVSTTAAVQTPAVVDLTNPEHAPMSTPARFGVRDLLAGVLSDFVSLFKRYGREAAFAVNTRRLDG